MARPARRDTIRFGERLSYAGEILRSAFSSGPGIAWVSVFLLLPLIGIGVISFLTRGTYGEIQLPVTLENYRRLLGFGLLGFDPQYPQIILRSLFLGAGATLVCLLAALPLAFFIAALEGRRKQAAHPRVVSPFWTPLLIRTYAWQILHGPDSALARIATGLHLAEAGTPLYPSAFAVYIGMLCAYLPFMVLPLYTAVEKIDWSLAEAAADLGADGRRVFRHAILPQVLPGMVAGIILVFIPATGQFVVPDLLGGAKTVMLGNAVQQQFGPSRDWPFGSAIAFVGMIVMMFGLWANAKLAAREGEEGLL
jgi:spermidine/putrescine transport system permease protein